MGPAVPLLDGRGCWGGWVGVGRVMCEGDDVMCEGWVLCVRGVVLCEGVPISL